MKCLDGCGMELKDCICGATSTEDEFRVDAVVKCEWVDCNENADVRLLSAVVIVYNFNGGQEHDLYRR